ncbi:unnamed protein product [Victoria cruziana]
MEASANGTKQASNISDIVHKFAKVCRLRSIGVFADEDANGNGNAFEDGSDTTTAGSKETDDNVHQKVHPQPLEEGLSSSATARRQEALETLISKLFANISSLKSAYIQLQAAHTPYDADKIQAADKLVIAELKNLSELKHSYRESAALSSPLSFPKDSRLVAEIQEQQSLLKTYEVMVKKFQAQIQAKDSEILQLRREFDEMNRKTAKLEKRLKRKGLLPVEAGAEVEEASSNLFSVELTPGLFVEATEAAARAAHDFSKPLINMMKEAGWDLDAAANAIEPGVVYAKRAHKKFAFESYVCRRMFGGFHEESFSVKSEGYSVSREGFFHQFLAIRAMDALDVVSENPDCAFGKFCRTKYLEVVHSKMEMSFFGNLDQRNYIANGGHPRTPFYLAFLMLAKAVWLLHRLAFSFEPKVEIFQVKKGTEFSEVYMESVVKNVVPADDDRENDSGKVGFTVMPGFKIGASVIQCKVYLSGMKCAD